MFIIYKVLWKKFRKDVKFLGFFLGVFYVIKEVRGLYK